MAYMGTPNTFKRRLVSFCIKGLQESTSFLDFLCRYTSCSFVSNFLLATNQDDPFLVWTLHHFTYHFGKKQDHVFTESLLSAFNLLSFRSDICKMDEMTPSNLSWFSKG